MPSVNRSQKNKVIHYTCDEVEGAIQQNTLFVCITKKPTARSIKCYNALVKKAKARDGIADVVLGSGEVEMEGGVRLPHTATELRLLEDSALSLEVAAKAFADTTPLIRAGA